MACKRSSVRSRLPPPINCREILSANFFEFSFFEQVCKDLFVGSSKVLTPSSRGLGHYPFTVGTGVRIPVGSPAFTTPCVVPKAQVGQQKARESRRLGSQERMLSLPGAVVQLVRIPACHAGGRGFESRPLRQTFKRPEKSGLLSFKSIFR